MYISIVTFLVEHKTPFGMLSREDTIRHMETMGKRVLPILDFIRSTQLNVGILVFHIYLIYKSRP